MKQRTVYWDNMKLFLIFLVVAHHTCRATELSSFLMTNMTFFMGAFFFIAGFFTAKSKEHREAGEFLKRRAKRLFIPILWLLIVIVPIYFYIGAMFRGVTTGNFLQYYIYDYWGKGQVSYEHGWFLVNLFLYSVLYVLVKKFWSCYRVKRRIVEKEQPLTALKIAAFTLLMIILSYFIRRSSESDDKGYVPECIFNLCIT